MASHTGELILKKYILAWPFPVPNVIRNLFAMVFMDILPLNNYIHQHLVEIETNAYHLVIAQDMVDYLFISQTNPNVQNVRIDVICDDEDQKNQVHHYVRSKYTNIKFWMIENLLEFWDQVLNEENISYLYYMNEKIQTGITIIIQTWSIFKRLSISHQRSQLAHRLPSILLNYFSGRNLSRFNSRYVCRCCKLIYRSTYQLHCGHQHCAVCIKIQKSCAECSQDIHIDQITESEMPQLDIQELWIQCEHCDNVVPFNEYSLHLRTKHLSSLIHFVSEHPVNENEVITSRNGSCVWEIRNFEQRKAACNRGSQQSIYSPVFYIFPNGYQMCLRLFMNGDGDAKGTHMSLFFVIMKSKNDDKLQWPFNYRVKFSVIDQAAVDDYKHHIIAFCRPNSNEECVDKPIRSMNVACGIKKFLPLKSVERIPNRYIKKNTMYIQLAIDLRKIEHIPSLLDYDGQSPSDEEHVDTTDDDIINMICGNIDEQKCK